MNDHTTDPAEGLKIWGKGVNQLNLQVILMEHNLLFKLEINLGDCPTAPCSTGPEPLLSFITLLTVNATFTL